MLWLPETIDRGVDSGRSCNCRCPILCVLSVTRVRSGFVIITQPFEFGIGVGWFSWPLGGVGVKTMPDAELDTTRCFEVPLCPGVQRLIVPGVEVGVFIDLRCLADRVDVTHWLISATWQLFSQDEGVKFRPSNTKATELPPWVESLSKASTVTPL